MFVRLKKEERNEVPGHFIKYAGIMIKYYEVCWAFYKDRN